MRREYGICEECGRRTPGLSVHASLCEWCRPACRDEEAPHGRSTGGPGRSRNEPEAANGGPREAEAKPACRDCGAELSDARRGRCLDCEVSHAFDTLGAQLEARRQSTMPRAGGPTS